MTDGIGYPSLWAVQRRAGHETTCGEHWGRPQVTCPLVTLKDDGKSPTLFLSRISMCHHLHFFSVRLALHWHCALSCTGMTPSETLPMSIWEGTAIIPSLR